MQRARQQVFAARAARATSTMARGVFTWAANESTAPRAPARALTRGALPAAGAAISSFLAGFDSVGAVDSSLTSPSPTRPKPQLTSAKSPRRRLAAAVVGLGALLLTGCQLPTFGAYKGATSQARSTFHLWQGFFIAGLIVGGFVLLLILWAIFRYRRRSDDIPGQTQYHTLTEIIYTVVPILTVIGLFVATVVVENKVDAVEPNPATVIHVYAFQWGWEFQYSNGVKVIGQTTDAPTMVVPTGQTVRIYLRSYDVLHGFYVPEFNFSRYASPGYWTCFDLNVLHNGVYRGQCTQLCGLYHSLMFFNVRSVSPSAYQTLAADDAARSSGRTRTPSASSRPACTPTSTAPCPATLAIRATPAAATPETQEVRSTVTDVIAPRAHTRRRSSTSRRESPPTATTPTAAATRTTARAASSSG